MTKVDTLKLCKDRLAKVQAEVLELAASDEYFFEALTDPATRAALYTGANDEVTEELHALVADAHYVCGFVVGTMAAYRECSNEGEHDLAEGFFLAGAVLSDLHAQATGTTLPSVG